MIGSITVQQVLAVRQLATPPLTPSEAHILLAMEAKGARLSTASYLRKATPKSWRDDYSDVHRVHIFHIRKKLGRDCIRPAKGRGYLLSPEALQRVRSAKGAA